MERKDNLKGESSSSSEIPSSSSSQGSERREKNPKLEHLKKSDAVSPSPGRVRVVDSVDLHKNLLEHKERRKLSEKPGSVTETGANALHSTTAWKYDPEIEEILRLQEATKQKIDDEEEPARPKEDKMSLPESEIKEEVTSWSQDSNPASFSESVANIIKTVKEGRNQVLEFMKMEDPKTSLGVVAAIKAMFRRKTLEQKQKNGPSMYFEQDPRWMKTDLSWKRRLDKDAEMTPLDRKEEEQKLKILEESEETKAQGLKISREYPMKPQILEDLEDIFGYRSKLKYPVQYRFKEDKAPIAFESETELTELDEGKDMTWILKMSLIDEEGRIQEKDHVETKTPDPAEKSFLFRLFLLIGGRMPFRFVRNSDTQKLQITCEMNKNNHRFYAFVITSIFIILMTLISIINLTLMIAEEEVNGYNQIEKLLLAKNKVSVVVFITSLMFASILSINVLINGDSIAKYITLWGKTLDEFHFKYTTGVMAVIIIYIVWTISLFLFNLSVFCTTNSDANPNSLVEATHLLIAIIFRSFVPKVLIQPAANNESEINISDNLLKYGIFIICLNAYALYCFLNFVMMVVIYSIGIRNMAYEWNFRLRLILHQASVKRNETFLRTLKRSLKYQNMFDYHQKIMVLVQDNSKVFCTILVAFYLTVALTLVAVVSQIAAFVFDRKELMRSPNDNDDVPELFSSNDNEDVPELYNVKKTPDHFLYLCFHLFQTIGMFLFVSLFLAETSAEVMRGETHVHRLGFINITSTHLRNFFMSLLRSFNPCKKQLLRAGRIFSIDRPFIFGFLAFYFYLFSIMVLSQRASTATIPTIRECPPDSGQCCIGIRLTTMEEIELINNANEAGALKCQNKLLRTTISALTTTISPTTTTAPTCLPRTTFIPNVTVPQNVPIRINGSDYDLCCSGVPHVGGMLTICHLSIPERNSKCSPRPVTVISHDRTNIHCTNLEESGETCVHWMECMCADVPRFTVNIVDILNKTTVNVGCT